MPISRETLFEQVWSEPMTAVAKRYDVTSTYLARICAHLNVPRPPRGYWQKRQAGDQVERPPLPPARVGDDLEWLRDEPRRDPAVPKVEPHADGPAAASAPPPRPARHPLIALARNEFLNSRISYAGHLEPRKHQLPDVVVSPSMLRNALAVANDLFSLLERRGHRVVIAPRDEYCYRPELNPMQRERGRKLPVFRAHRVGRGTLVYVGTVPIGLNIYETVELASARSEDGKWIRATPKMGQPPVYPHHFPTGRLAINAYAPFRVTDWQKHWQETTRGDLHGRLEEIASELEAAAPVVVKLVQEGEQRVQEERERLKAEISEMDRQAEFERQDKARKQSRDHLVAIVNQWSFATHVEKFFEDASRRATGLQPDERAAILSRLEHARTLLGGTDALRSLLSWKSPEELLRS